MKQFKNFFIALIAIVLVTIPFATSASAAKSSTEEEKLVKELAETLEFFFETASIKDDFGNIIGLDFTKLEDEYGPSPELELLKEQTKNQEIFIPNNSGIMLFSNDINECLNNKIKNGWKDALGVNQVTAAIDYALQGLFTDAARSLIKAGARGNLVGIAGQLYFWLGQCYVEKGW